MAKSQKNGITILLGLKGHQVGSVSEYKDVIEVEVSLIRGEVYCPYCGV